MKILTHGERLLMVLVVNLPNCQTIDEQSHALENPTQNKRKTAGKMIGYSRSQGPTISACSFTADSIVSQVIVTLYFSPPPSLHLVPAPLFQFSNHVPSV